MAINRGGSIARTYLLPQQQPQVNPQQQPFNDGVEALQGLQYVEGQTSDYYKKVQALKSFMQDAQANLGIDVRVPDLSRPESIKLNQIFRNAIADIMAQGNTLKNSQSMYAMAQQRGDMFFKDPTQQPFATMKPQQDFSMRSLEPIVTEANDLMQQAHYAGAYDKAKAIYEEKKAYYESKIASEPDKAQYYKYQLEGLTPPREGVKIFQDKSTYQDRATGRRVEAAGNILKEIANLQAGVSDAFTIDKTAINPESGSVLRTRPNFQEAFYGGKRIKSWGYDDSTRQSFLIFDDGTMQEVTSQNPLSLARIMMSENKATFGTDAEYLDLWADKHGVLKDDGSIDPYKLLRKDADKMSEQYRKTFDKDTTKAQLENLEEYLDKINQGSSGFLGFGRSSGDVRIKSSPIPLTVKKGSDGLYISNFKEVFPPTRDPKKQDAYKKALILYGPDSDGVSPAELKKFLQKYGAHVLLNQPATQTGTKAAPTPTPSQPSGENDPLGIRG